MLAARPLFSQRQHCAGTSSLVLPQCTHRCRGCQGARWPVARLVSDLSCVLVEKCGAIGSHPQRFPQKGTPNGTYTVFVVLHGQKNKPEDLLAGHHDAAAREHTPKEPKLSGDGFETPRPSNPNQKAEALNTESRSSFAHERPYYHYDWFLRR